MKASELRLGNYYDHNGNIGIVTVNVMRDVWEAERTWCKPLILTEELLIKLGFEKHKKIPLSYVKDGFIISKGRFVSFYCYFEGEDENSHEIIIEHVHKLQNVFFEFKNKELVLTQSEFLEVRLKEIKEV